MKDKEKKRGTASNKENQVQTGGKRQLETIKDEQRQGEAGRGQKRQKERRERQREKKR